MISFRIVSPGKLENLSWTIFDAITASLAPFFYDMNFASSDLNFIRIQRNPPVFHRPFLENDKLRRGKAAASEFLYRRSEKKSTEMIAGPANCPCPPPLFQHGFQAFARFLKIQHKRNNQAIGARQVFIFASDWKLKAGSVPPYTIRICTGGLKSSIRDKPYKRRREL